MRIESTTMSWEWWGEEVDYGVGLERQKARRNGVLAGQSMECLALLEHKDVITTGRRPVDKLPSQEELSQLGTEIFRTERGGLATWHGPGQLVGYLICAVARRGWKVRSTVAALELGLVHWLGQHGVEGEMRREHPGVWVGKQKIASVGLHFRHGVSMHGFALNLHRPGMAIQLIQPCGLAPGAMTSLEEQSGECISPGAAAAEVASLVLNALANQNPS